MDDPPPRLPRRARLRADGAGPAAEHRDGVAPVAGGPQAPTASPWRRGRHRDEPRPERRVRMIDLPSSSLRGSLPPLVTPVVGGDIDEDTYAALVELHVREGSSGVVVCGTSGEPSVLTVDERKRLLEVAIET